MYSSIVKLFVVIVISMFAEGNAIQCYQCYAEGDENCVSEKVECPSNLPGYCGNLIGTYSGKRFVHQGCLRVNNCDTAAEDFRKYLKLSKTDLFVVDCSSCSSDLCNSASRINKFTFTSLVYTIMIILFHIV